MIDVSVRMLAEYPQKGRNLAMPGDPHYQPGFLKPYLGYDNRVLWQILVEWHWMCGLAEHGIMPEEDAKLLTNPVLRNLLSITTTQVTKVERKVTNHDILALLIEMRKRMPKPLHRWLHWGLTSYDVICTAFALQAQQTFCVLDQQAQKVDVLWREKIAEHAATLQNGHTHLQVALPVTVGFWLSVPHARFVNTIRRGRVLSGEVLGKFSGAVGTQAFTRAHGIGSELEDRVLNDLGLPQGQLATQITQPESLARLYFELTLLSAALANLGHDVRHLQMAEIGEVGSVSSRSSTMSHKASNPVAAENLAGMHRSVRGEMEKITANINSDLQRDLTGSSVMRAYGGLMVYVGQQLLTAERLLKSLTVNVDRCRSNFELHGRLVTGELLHLVLQREGFPDAHKFVNKTIVPRARTSGNTLLGEMEAWTKRSRSQTLKAAWARVPEDLKHTIGHPETYLGAAVLYAEGEAHNVL
jgi:adenylosuccinate lyase